MITAADAGPECEKFYQIIQKRHPLIMYFKCSQHRLHNAENAATSAELPNLVGNLRIYNRVIRDYETRINDLLRRILGIKQSDAEKLNKPEREVKVCH